jgi:hypothetical protein
MGKNQDPESGIRDKHPGSATLREAHNWALVAYTEAIKDRSEALKGM